MLRVNAETGEIFLYGVIGGESFMEEGVLASELIEALAEIPGRVLVRINSPGGVIDDGIAMYNALKRHPGGVDTVVDSLAASMGSYVMLAGEKRTIAKNARVMIHSPWTMAAGNANELRKIADVLETHEISMVDAYAEASGKPADEILAIMANETWYTADNAVKGGFATEIGLHPGETPKVPKGLFRNTPKGLIRERSRNSVTNAKAKIALIKSRLTA